MFIGHYGVGLAGKTTAPRASLATWFAAVQLLDLLWPIFLLLGWEHVRIAPGITRLTPLDFYDYPITHSLVGAIAWSIAFAAVYRVVRPTAGGRTAALLGLGVFSHWLLDLLVHRPDLPLLPHGPYVGLGLWNLPAVAVPLELAIYLGGVALYLSSTRPRPGGTAAGRWATWLLLLALPGFWLAATFGPPPPDTRSLAWGGLLLWLFLPWAWWCDRNREPRQLATPRAA
jgi:membrane-bound metal-dependent hydrolase YbcI (DUF457 family)